MIEDGHKAVVLEKHEKELGGNWVFSEKDEHPSIYESIVINTSKQNMSFSDFPTPKKAPYFMHHSQIKKYFDDYADHFGLRQHIRFGKEVLDVEKKGKLWQVTHKDVHCGTIEKQLFDAVIIANGKRFYLCEHSFHNFKTLQMIEGHHNKPHEVTFKGEETFPGEVLHSHAYKKVSPFAGKRVLVVGCGNSGADISVACADACEKVYNAVRTGVLVFPKYIFGAPVDFFGNRLFYMLPDVFQLLFVYPFVYAIHGYQKVNILKKQHTTVNESYIPRVKAGKICVKPNVKQIYGKIVEFVDGSKAEVDVIIKAVGYKVHFPFLSHKLLKIENNQIKTPLFKNAIPFANPELEGLYFLCLIQPLGSTMPIAEMQSRWFSLLLANQLRLPNEKEMSEDVRKYKEEMKSKYYESARHTIQYDYMPIMDGLASLIGCYPKFERHLDILFPLLFGTIVSAQYRLDGPGAKEKICKQIIRDYFEEPNPFHD